MGYTLTQREFVNLKSALTRARKKGPQAVFRECNRALAIFEEKGYPDSWHTWERAKGDAEIEILRGPVWQPGKRA